MSKRLTVLVGPQGAGKSTISQDIQNGDPDTVIVSQDTMGQKGHMLAFEQAVKDGKSIVVDRINHTRDQRKRYISIAEAAGYTTEIFVYNQPIELCFDRMMAREGHPTIKTGDWQTCLSALRTYFAQYERPDSDEADSVVRMTPFDPQLLDLNNLLTTDELYDRKVIVIGDVHGCYTELMSLLEKMDYKKGEDVIIFCGDLIDRGPQVREVLEFAMNTPLVFSVMGNHEWKLARYGMSMAIDGKSKVKIGHGLQETLDQIKDMDKHKLLMWLWNLPLSIKFHNNYVVHAGINPRYPMHKQNREFMLYARKFDAASNSFSDDSAPYWYEHDLHPSFETGNIFFGHEVHKITDPLHFAIFHKNKNVYPMDGGCVFGENLLGCSIGTHGYHFMSVPSLQPKTEHEVMYENWQEPYEERVQAGYLSKSETDDLVLYNYTDKCAYEKKWDKYTLESRGLIFEKATGKVVARPFPKFFNLGEGSDSQLQNLPKESYECFEKMDGSLGIIFYYKGKWHVATRGSFYSEQAVKAAEMLKGYGLDVSGHAVGANVTLLAEIIYPKNKIVINYGNEEKLVLLGAYCSITGHEFSYDELSGYAKNTKMPIAPRFNLTIPQMIEMQKTLPADKEGFVVRFKSGYRVKIKGAEYMKMHKIISSITPLFFYELMLESEDFSVAGNYLASIPEECRDEALDIIFKIRLKRDAVLSQIKEDLEMIPIERPENPEENREYKRNLGLWLKENSSQLKHASVIFPYVLENQVAVEKYVRKAVRPTGNVL